MATKKPATTKAPAKTAKAPARPRRGPSHPKDSPWYAPRQEDRKRKIATFSLSDEARAELEELSQLLGRSKSELVEELIHERFAKVRQ